MNLDTLLNLKEFEEQAKKTLSPMAYDYYRSGALDEITLRENRAAFERIALRYRVLVDVSKRSPQAKILGQNVSMPILIAPTAFQGLAHKEGEIATARAAKSHHTIMILSTLSNQPLEKVVQAAKGFVWFQLYIYKDREATKALVSRAKEAGCQAIVLTVDTPVLGRREQDIRNKFHLPKHLSAINLVGEKSTLLKPPDNSGLAAYFSNLIEPSLCWKDLDWLCTTSGLPVFVKGIVRADDAIKALEHGASGIIVSNHGGRQLDTAPATIDVLEEIASAIENRLEILLDGGVRRGVDVLKALALGAKGVLIGRPVLWGLALGGTPGVSKVLSLLYDEFDQAMALCGCRALSEITPDLIAHTPSRFL